MNLAVYGILRSDLAPAGTYIESASVYFLEPMADLVGPCVIPGLLYGGGCAALFSGDGRVVGQLWKVRQPIDKKLLAKLDLLEGAYERRTIQLLEPDVTADAYFYNYHRDEVYRIPSGDWKDRLF